MADLPEEIWKSVLQYVPLKQRLTSCALVCHKLRVAATAATDSIQACLSRQLSVDVLLAFLQKYGRQLTGISLNANDRIVGRLMVPQQLPSCQHLQQLRLKGFDVDLSPADGPPGALDSLTGLTRLELQDCEFNSGRARGAAALAVLVNLQHLCLKHDPYIMVLYPVSDLVWPCLQQLTHLELADVELEGEDLRGVSCLTKLQVLHLDAPRCWVYSTAPNSFPFPASLHYFHFTGDLGPGALEGALQLTGLELFGGGYRANAAAAAADGGGGGVYLLGVLPKLQHLRALGLDGLEIDWPPPSPDYTTLVPSNNLRSLTLGSCLPKGALAHAFSTSPPRAIQLTKLELAASVYNYQRFLDAGDVKSVVSGCPLLQQLVINAQAGPHLTSLTQLSSLTRLKLMVGSDRYPDVTVSVQCLSGLTSLHHLTLYPRVHGSITEEALLPLTALRQLTSLKWGRTSCTGAALLSKAGPNQAPDVWLRLLQHCAADSSCHPDIIRSLTQQVAEQQQRLAEQQQQLAEQQQQTAALQELVSRQGAQLQALQDQVQSCLQRL